MFLKYFGLKIFGTCERVLASEENFGSKGFWPNISKQKLSIIRPGLSMVSHSKR